MASYLLGLHRVHYGSLPGVLVDEQVHVVVSEGWQDFHLHVGLAHCLGLPQLVLCVQEFSSQLCWTWAPKNSQSSALVGDKWDRAWQVGQLTGQPSLPPSDKRSEATTGQNLVPLRVCPEKDRTLCFPCRENSLGDQRDLKRQERRMELAKGQPRMVTLQKRHKGHVRAKKKNKHKKRKEGKKKRRNIEIHRLLCQKYPVCY